MSRCPSSSFSALHFQVLTALLLVASAQPATAQPLRVSAEVPISRPRLGAIAEPATLLDVSPAGNGFSAMWALEDRSVRLVEIDAQGSPNHGSTHVLFEGGPDTRVVAAGRTDDGPVLVWYEKSALVVGGAGATGVFTNRVEIASAADTPTFTRMVCGRSRCAVVFEIFSQPGQTRLAIVDAGARIHSISALPAVRVNGGAAIDSGFYLLARNESTGLFHALRVSVDGAVRFDRGLAGGPSVNAITASDGQTMFVFWPQSGSLNAMTVSLDGTVSAPRQLGAIEGLPVTAVWNGAEFLLALQQSGSAVPEELPPSVLRGLRVSSDLNRLDATPFPLATDGYSNAAPRLSWNGVRYYVGWHRALSGFAAPRVLVGALVSAGTGAGSVSPLAVGPIRQEASLVARASTQSVVAWQELDALSGVYELRFARIAPGNVVLSEEVAATGSLAFLSAASSGSDVLLLWNRCSNSSSCHPLVLEGLIVRSDGSRQTVRLDGLTRANQVALAGNREGWLIVAAEPESYKMVTARISRSGLVSPFRVAARDGAHAMAASDGNGFAVVSFATISPSCPVSCVGLWIAFFDSQGALVREQKLPHDVAVGLTYAAGVYSVAMNDAGAQIVMARFDTSGRYLGARTIYRMTETSYRYATSFHRLGNLLALTWSGSSPVQMATLLTVSGDFAGEMAFPYLRASTADDHRATAFGGRKVVIGQYAPTQALISVEIETSGSGRTRLTR